TSSSFPLTWSPNGPSCPASTPVWSRRSVCATASISSCSTSTRWSRRSFERQSQVAGQTPPLVTARRCALLRPTLPDYDPIRRPSVSHTVLVCDDAIFMRTMISDILAQAGFEVVGEAETGAQAVEKYKQLKPDLVTMDIVMPDMGGIDAVREIVKGDPDAKVLMCSAMGQQALVVEAIQAGAKDFVVKPFQPSRVLEAVQRVLGKEWIYRSTPSCSRPRPAST